MSTAYWCILIAAALPYAWVAIAKSAVPGYNNKDPRGWIARQDNYRVRNAFAAHQNALEAFPAFAAAVLMAKLAEVDPQRFIPAAVRTRAPKNPPPRLVWGLGYNRNALMVAPAHAILAGAWRKEKPRFE